MTRTEELHAALRLADWEGAYTVRTLMADTLQAERDEAVALLRNLTSHYTTHPHCGHNFTCVCKDADIAKARAFLARLDEEAR